MELSETLTLLSSPNVDVTIDPKLGANCMHFLFKGRFSKEASERATKAWIREFENNPEKKYTLIWNCLKMSNFDFNSQNDWMQTLSQFSPQIVYICIVSNSLLIRGAARVMSKFSKLDLRLYRSLEEIKLE